jgi:DNA mismatch repair protein MutL
LTADEYAAFEEQRLVFTNIGFGFHGEGKSLTLLEVPSLLKRIEPSQFFHLVLRELRDGRSEPELTSFKHKLFATMACKAAVKAGDALSDIEKRRLIDDLLSLPDRFTCPHGRPSYITFSPKDLEKLFKRTGF